MHADFGCRVESTYKFSWSLGIPWFDVPAWFAGISSATCKICRAPAELNWCFQSCVYLMPTQLQNDWFPNWVIIDMGLPVFCCFFFLRRVGITSQAFGVPLWKPCFLSNLKAETIPLWQLMVSSRGLTPRVELSESSNLPIARGNWTNWKIRNQLIK